MHEEKYGKLKILEEVGRNNRGEILFKCLCECGSTKVVKKYNLTSGKTKSCGCIKTGIIRKDHIGEQHNRLLIVEYVKQSKCRQSIYKCLCDCGSYKNVLYRNLSNNTTKSCGCYNRERDRAKELNPNYNPSLTDLDRKSHRACKGYKKWIKSIKERDGHQCLICGTNENLVVHHLESYHNNLELRVCDTNGVCLCQFCHLKFHKTHGYRNNTKHQFDIFLKNEKKKLK